MFDLMALIFYAGLVWVVLLLGVGLYRRIAENRKDIHP